MSEQPMVQGFLIADRAAFESLDIAAIEELFSYPCPITSGADRIEVTVVPARKEWLPKLERLSPRIGIGVRSAEPTEVEVTALSSRLVQATVRWRLSGQGGGPLYDFIASYTLADLGAGMRIAAIAHDEASRLRALVSAARLSYTAPGGKTGGGPRVLADRLGCRLDLRARGSPCRRDPVTKNVSNRIRVRRKSREARTRYGW